jgi:uncharacterized protein with FMN-binding domain
MRRALLTLGGTAAGLAALLSFKTHSLASALPAPATPPSATAMTPASAMTSQPMANGAGSGSASPAASKQASAVQMAGAGRPASSSTVTGMVADTQYGPMQVQLTLSGTRIIKVTVLQRTNLGALSSEIDASAIPTLTDETLAAQSAHIDAVSGATYTSSGYIMSLQSALDQAGA